MRILITGAAGAVGSTLVNGMKDRHSIRGLDRLPMPDLEDTIQGDVADFDTMCEATKDMEAVIHLTGVDREWDGVLQSNLIGTYNMLEASRLNGVKRIAYASRAGVLGPYPKSMKRTVDMRPRPVGFYTVSKVFGEALGHSYASQYDMSFVAVRIGNFNRNRPLPEHPHHLGHADAVRVFEQAITHPDVKFEIVFGVSDSNWPLYDLDHGRLAIGYYPQDHYEHQ
ncbi:MAG: NAD(P)-dependent oxidoreductase [Candidatus Poribacteria bacterium]|nr:NAD(P)-dependent oxidoreductase [Candidatus Poribacteria bacterium]